MDKVGFQHPHGSDPGGDGAKECGDWLGYIYLETLAVIFIL